MQKGYLITLQNSINVQPTLHNTYRLTHVCEKYFLTPFANLVNLTKQLSQNQAFSRLMLLSSVINCFKQRVKCISFQGVGKLQNADPKTIKKNKQKNKCLAKTSAHSALLLCERKQIVKETMGSVK